MHFRGLRFAVLAMVVALAFVVTAAADVGSGSGPPTSIGTGGAASSVEKLATQAAIDILRRGGNAVDAAGSAAAVLGVTEPFWCGVGGGGFMVLRAAGGAVTTIDGRETAPAAMQPMSFWQNGAPLPFNDRATAASRSECLAPSRRGWTRSKSPEPCHSPSSSRRRFTSRVTAT